MLKSIRFRIVITFLILGILGVSALGITYVNELHSLKNDILQNPNNVSEIMDVFAYDTKILTIIIISFFTLAIGVFGSILAKIMISPLTNLVKTAEQATKNDRVKYLGDGTKKKYEINDLVTAFESMNNDLINNLNEATRQSKQMETIMLHMTDGIIAFDIEGNIIHINPAAKTFLEIKDEKSFEEIFDKFNVDINLEKIIYLENWTSSEKMISVGERTINLFFAPFKNENDRPGGVIVVIQDITEHVKLDSMRKRFVADVSHELKTPITSIMGYADTLLSTDVDEEINHKFLDRISKEAERMSVLVNDLLTLSRYDTSKAKINKTEFDLGELVKDTFDGLEIEMQKKNHVAECFVTANVPLVYADKSGIQRVVLNILTNAIKYTPENGNIKVYVGFIYNDAYIKIIDNGIGIPKEDLDKIYERFYRVDKARTREMGGTGLGLSIAKEILDQNDSMIDIKSELEKGTEVVIRIPTKQGKSNKGQNTEE